MKVFDVYSSNVGGVRNGTLGIFLGGGLNG